MNQSWSTPLDKAPPQPEPRTQPQSEPPTLPQSGPETGLETGPETGLETQPPTAPEPEAASTATEAVTTEADIEAVAAPAAASVPSGLPTMAQLNALNSDLDDIDAVLARMDSGTV